MSRRGFPVARSDLLPLSLGAALLGTGGGGNPYIGMLRLRELLRKGASRRGAAAGGARRRRLRRLGRRHRRAGRRRSRRSSRARNAFALCAASRRRRASSVAALISAEIGGSNSIEPILTAAYAGLPVVDGDGMGRAFPEMQMSTFFIYGLDPSPGAIADDKGNVVVFKKVVDMFWLERFARHVAVDMGARRGLRHRRR